jgi:hypothetical protein
MLFPVISIVLLTSFLCRHDELLSSENRRVAILGGFAHTCYLLFLGLLLLLFLERSE